MVRVSQTELIWILGISLQYDRNRRVVSCQNNCKSLKVYVLSYLMNVECGKHGESLIQIMPGGQR